MLGNGGQELWVLVLAPLQTCLKAWGLVCCLCHASISQSKPGLTVPTYVQCFKMSMRRYDVKVTDCCAVILFCSPHLCVVLPRLWSGSGIQVFIISSNCCSNASFKFPQSFFTSGGKSLCTSLAGLENAGSFFHSFHLLLQFKLLSPHHPFATHFPEGLQ